MAKRKKKARKAGSDTEQMGLFDKPSMKKRRRKRLGSGEARQYRSKAGHVYELRRIA